MAERQAEHRQNIEVIVVKTSSERSLLGVKYAFFIAIAVFILSGVCLCLGQIAAGGINFGSTLVSLVGAFIYGTNSDRHEREEKFEKAQQANPSAQNKNGLRLQIWRQLKRKRSTPKGVVY